MGGEAAIPEATEVIEGFADRLPDRLAASASAPSSGLTEADCDGDCGLAHRLLDIMAACRGRLHQLTFRALAEGTADGAGRDRRLPDLAPGLAGPPAGCSIPGRRPGAMRRANPAVIPRNHRIER